MKPFNITSTLILSLLSFSVIGQNIHQEKFIPNRLLNIHVDENGEAFYLYGTTRGVDWLASIQKYDTTFNLDWEYLAGSQDFPTHDSEVWPGDRPQNFFDDIKIAPNGLIIARYNYIFESLYREHSSTHLLNQNGSYLKGFSNRAFQSFHKNKAILRNYVLNYNSGYFNNTYCEIMDLEPPFNTQTYINKTDSFVYYNPGPIDNLIERRGLHVRNYVGFLVGFTDSMFNVLPFEFQLQDLQTRYNDRLIYNSDTTFIHFRQISRAYLNSSNRVEIEQLSTTANIYDKDLNLLHSVSKKIDYHINDLYFLPDSGFIVTTGHGKNNHIVRFDGRFNEKWKFFSPANEYLEKLSSTADYTYFTLFDNTNTRIMRIDNNYYPFHLLSDIGAGGPGSYIDELHEKNTVHVYPNPSTGRFTLVHPENKSMNYQVINLQGQIVLSGRTQGEINLENHPKGMYFLKLEKQRKVLKLVKE